jgi:hypothetical protein
MAMRRVLYFFYNWNGSDCYWSFTICLCLSIQRWTPFRTIKHVGTCSNDFLRRMDMVFDYWTCLISFFTLQNKKAITEAFVYRLNTSLYYRETIA